MAKPAEKFLPEEQQEIIFIAVENSKEELNELATILAEKEKAYKEAKETEPVDPAQLKLAKIEYQGAMFKIAKLNFKIKHLSDKLIKNVEKEVELEFSEENL